MEIPDKIISQVPETSFVHYYAKRYDLEACYQLTSKLKKKKEVQKLECYNLQTRHCGMREQVVCVFVSLCL